MKCLCCSSSRMSSLAFFVILIPIWLNSQGSGGQHGMLMGLFTTESDEPTARSSEAEEKKPVSKYVLDYEMETIDGEKIKLSQFKGKVVLMVNVASKCGLTPQYEGLEALYEKYEKQGLVIIGFPANNFGSQEPGTNEEIVEFCSKNYGVSFQMMSKISVKGKDAHPLYKQLAAQPEPVGGEPEWNFDKFIVNRQGEVVVRFKPRTVPEDPELVKVLEELLKEE